MNNNIIECRICLDNNGIIISSPCECKGTTGYIHEECLNRWRYEIPIIPYDINYKRQNYCDICKQRYKDNIKSEKFKCINCFNVFIEVFFLILFINIFSFLIGILFNYIYKENVIFDNNYIDSYIIGIFLFHTITGLIIIFNYLRNSTLNLFFIDCFCISNSLETEGSDDGLCFLCFLIFAMFAILIYINIIYNAINRQKKYLRNNFTSQYTILN